MPDLYEMISASVGGQDESSPEPQADTDGGGGALEQSSGVAEAAPPSGHDDEGEYLGQPFDWKAVPEQLLPLAKGFQSSYTRRMQEVAEQRKQMEALQHRDAWQSVERLLAEDPAQAAAWFRQQAEWLSQGATGEQTDTDPYADLTPATDTEAALLEKLRQVEQQQRGLLEWQQQQQLAYQQQQIAREFTDLEKSVGRSISEEERRRVAAFCVENQIPNVALGFRAMRFDEELTAARQAGVNQGASVVQQKQAMAAPPSSLVNRAGAEAERPKDLSSLLGAVYDELAAG